MLYNRGYGKRKGQPPRRSHGTVKLPTLTTDIFEALTPVRERHTMQKEIGAMNKNLSEAIEKMQKVQALMTAYEAVYLDLDVPPEERERADLAISTFYAIWDYIKGTTESLEALEGDCQVVDAIYAAESVRRRTLTTE